MVDNHSSRRKEDFVERRKKPDWVVKAVTICSIIGWALAVLAMLFMDFASPKKENFFSRLFQAPVDSGWNSGLLIFILVILTMVFFLCLIGLIFNMSRHKRKSDKFSKSLIFLGVASLVALIAYFMYFSRFIF